MTAKQIHGIDGILGDLISAPCQQGARAVETAHLIEEATPSTLAGSPPAENDGGSIQGARRGRPFGTRTSADTSREKVTLRIPSSLIAEYRDRSWEARCSLSSLVERAMIEHRRRFRA
jgi:hypothetical protein